MSEPLSEAELSELERVANVYKLTRYAWQLAKVEHGDNHRTTVERMWIALDAEHAYLRAVSPEVLEGLLRDAKAARAEAEQMRAIIDAAAAVTQDAETLVPEDPYAPLSKSVSYDKMDVLESVLNEYKAALTTPDGQGEK